MKTAKRFDVRKLVLLALLTAIVVVLQSLATILPVYPFKLTLVLVPIVIGSALINMMSGAWLGLVFGIIVLLSPDVAPFMTFNPAATIILVLLRGMLAGLISGAVYKALSKMNKTVAVITAAIVCPIVNTGIFTLGIYLFFVPLISEWAAGAVSVTAFIFVVMIGVNFIIEFIINLVLSPVIVRLVQLGQDRREN